MPIVNFGGILLLVKFPSKLIQRIRSRVGGGRAANSPYSGEPLSDSQLGSNNITIKHTRPEALTLHCWATDNNTCIWIRTSGGGRCSVNCS